MWECNIKQNIPSRWHGVGSKNNSISAPLQQYLPSVTNNITYFTSWPMKATTGLVWVVGTDGYIKWLCLSNRSSWMREVGGGHEWLSDDSCATGAWEKQWTHYSNFRSWWISFHCIVYMIYHYCPSGNKWLSFAVVHCYLKFRSDGDKVTHKELFYQAHKTWCIV